MCDSVVNTLIGLLHVNKITGNMPQPIFGQSILPKSNTWDLCLQSTCNYEDVLRSSKHCCMNMIIWVILLVAIFCTENNRLWTLRWNRIPILNTCKRKQILFFAHSCPRVMSQVPYCYLFSRDWIFAILRISKNHKIKGPRKFTLLAYWHIFGQIMKICPFHFQEIKFPRK